MRVILVSAFVLLSIVGWSHSGFTAGQHLDLHDGSALTITSPQNGDMVGTSFELTYELRKGLSADHAHVFLDGQYQKGFKGTFRDVAPGPHTITVKVANHDHDMLNISDSVRITVE
ncbi:MAG: hypothetical protein MRJ96_11220 [Nitrospirales bacterium]|nr:hypothetical protein [Nitrospira sp.]MDR4502011.1 hypothetical protein [Nitrospirales bacterium]